MRRLLGTFLFAFLASPLLWSAPSDLDVSFGSGGTRIYNSLIDNYYDQVPRLAQLSDGRIIIGRTCKFGNGLAMCAVRLLPNGSADSSFGTGGQAYAPPWVKEDRLYAITIQRDGGILLGGNCNTVSGYYRGDLCVIRLLSTGDIDTTFGMYGYAVIPSEPAYDSVSEIRELADGKILLTGDCDIAPGASGPSTRACAVRLTSRGDVDTTFGNSGRFLLNTTALIANVVYGAELLDGKMVVVGACARPRRLFCAFRLHPDGILDASYGSNGVATVAITSSNYENPSAALIQPDGRLLIAGRCSLVTDGDLACLARFNVDGSVDRTFGVDGSLTRKFGIADIWSLQVTLQPDGRIFLAGTCKSLAQEFTTCAMRMFGNGQPDTEFAAGATAFYRLGQLDSRATDVLLQRDGAAVIAGKCSDGAEYKLCALRLTGGPFGYLRCSMDIDGDGQLTALGDSLILTRVLLGFRGAAVTAGIDFQATAVRRTWPEIRTFLVSQCGMALTE